MKKIGQNSGFAYMMRLVPARIFLATVLNGVALVLDFRSLGKKALATLGAATGENGAAILGCHAGTESELVFAAALGRLIGPLAHN